MRYVLAAVGIAWGMNLIIFRARWVAAFMRHRRGQPEWAMRALPWVLALGAFAWSGFLFAAL